MRTVGVALIVLVIVILVIVAAGENRPIQFPLVHASAPDARANMLFSPCPLKQQNLPRYRKVET
jgi:hypothetical protein